MTCTLRMSKVALEGKTKLPPKVVDCINDLASVLQQVIKGSKSTEALNVAAKNFALQEAAVENSDANLKRMCGISAHLNSQMDAIQKSIEIMSEVQDRLQILEKTQYWSKNQR